MFKTFQRLRYGYKTHVKTDDPKNSFERDRELNIIDMVSDLDYRDLIALNEEGTVASDYECKIVLQPRFKNHNIFVFRYNPFSGSPIRYYRFVLAEDETQARNIITMYIDDPNVGPILMGEYYQIGIH